MELDLLLFDLFRMRNTRWQGSNDIPEEILIDILVRLPLKFIFLCMCVCKSWSNLIRSSSFISAHLNWNLTKKAHTFLMALNCNRGKHKILHSLFSNETFNESLNIAHPLGTKQRFWIYGSSNGLVCVSVPHQLRWNSPIYLYNPSIRKYVILPPTNIVFKRFARIFIILSFGFHPKLNDYKVVRMVRFVKKKTSSIEVEVYSLSKLSWKQIAVIPTWIKTMWWYCNSGSSMFNGVAYWIMTKDDHSCYLVSFDTSSEAFEEIPVPDAIGKTGHPRIDKYRESICLLERNIGDRDHEPEHIDMWILRDKSFIRFHSLVLPGMCLSPLSFSLNNDLVMEYHEEFSSQGSDNSSYLALYNLESRQVSKTGIVLAQTPYCEYNANAYIESLVLLDDHRKGTYYNSIPSTV